MREQRDEYGQNGLWSLLVKFGQALRHYWVPAYGSIDGRFLHTQWSFWALLCVGFADTTGGTYSDSRFRFRYWRLLQQYLVFVVGSLISPHIITLFFIIYARHLFAKSSTQFILAFARGSIIFIFLGGTLHARPMCHKKRLPYWSPWKVDINTSIEAIQINPWCFADVVCVSDHFPNQVSRYIAIRHFSWAATN